MSKPTSEIGTSLDGIAPSRRSVPESDDVPAAVAPSGYDQDPGGADGIGVTVPALKAAMHAAGYRVEELPADTTTVLRSATGGLGFEIRLGNRLIGPAERYRDVAFVALLTIQGDFPRSLLNDWNKHHRFGRLYLDRPTPDHEFLVLSMDVVFVAYATAQQLRAHIEIWDALAQQLVAWLNKELRQLAINARPASSGSAETAQPTNDQTRPTS